MSEQLSETSDQRLGVSEEETPYQPDRGVLVANLHGRANVAMVLHGLAVCFLALPSIVGALLAWTAHRIAERDLVWANRLVRWSKAFFVLDLVFYLALIVTGLVLAARRLT